MLLKKDSINGIEASYSDYYKPFQSDERHLQGQRGNNIVWDDFIYVIKAQATLYEDLVRFLYGLKDMTTLRHLFPPFFPARSSGD